MAGRIDLNCEGMQPVERIDLLSGLLIKDRKSVLFVGEGDFSFTVAFATLRESEKHIHNSTNNLGVWDGIISTRYERISYAYPEPDFRHILRNCKSEFRSNCSHLNDTGLRQLRTFDRMTPPPHHQSWRYGVDALHIQHLSALNPEVVWFQCPWLPGSESVYPLIHSFLKNTWEQIWPGKYVCIGLTKHERYVDRYDLQDVLGYWRHRRFFSTDVSDYYEFCGADQRLVKSILYFGYHHQGSTNTDIHDLIKDDHVTLVFRKKRQSNSQKRDYNRY